MRDEVSTQFPFDYILDERISRKLVVALKNGEAGTVRDILCEIRYPAIDNQLDDNRISDLKDTIKVLCAILLFISIEIGMSRAMAVQLRDKYLEQAKHIRTYQQGRIVINSIFLRFSNEIGGLIPESVDSRIVNEAIKYIEEHIDENIKSNTIAKEIGTSEPNICRTFKNETGITISTYINRRKIAYAAELLSGSNMKLGEMSKKLGYKNQQYFSKVFRKIKGMTPAEYRMWVFDYPTSFSDLAVQTQEMYS